MELPELSNKGVKWILVYVSRYEDLDSYAFLPRSKTLSFEQRKETSVLSINNYKRTHPDNRNLDNVNNKVSYPTYDPRVQKRLFTDVYTYDRMNAS